MYVSVQNDNATSDIYFRMSATGLCPLLKIQYGIHSMEFIHDNTMNLFPTMNPVLTFQLTRYSCCAHTKIDVARVIISQ